MGTIELEEGITHIPACLFKDCTGIKEITIPDTVTKIETWAFDNCTLLTDIYIPATLTEVGKSAFSGCNNLTAVHYAAVESDKEYITIGNDNDYFLNADWFYGTDRIKFLVAFNSMGGSEVPSEYVVIGTKVTKPADPTKEGKVFGGWFTDANFNIAWDFDTKTISDKTTLYARWDDENFTVKFDAQDGSTPNEVKVIKGEKVTKPADPTRDGYTFDGWYTDEALTTAYDFSTAVTSDITLYAKWKDEGTSTSDVTVTFESNGGSAVASATVKKGEKVTKPADPKREGYTFGGWYTDAACTTAYDFNTVITADITIYAKWTAATKPEDPDKPEETKQFTLGRDNNSWPHVNIGTYRKDYLFTDKKYYNSLISGLRSSEISHIKDFMSESWRGSCYGISATMALLYNGEIEIGQLTDESVSDYYSISKPSENKKFDNAINFYMLTQLIDGSSGIVSLPWSSNEENLKEGLKSIVESTSENKAIGIGYRFYGNPEGHRIIGVHCDEEDSKYIIKCYDMNSVGVSGEGSFTTLEISKDYSKFNLITPDGSTLTKDNYARLSVGNFNKKLELKSSAFELTEVDKKHVKLHIKSGTEIKNAAGEKLYYGDTISGDLKVYDVNFASMDESTSDIIEVDASDYFIVKGDKNKIDIAVGGDDGYYAVEGDNLDSATISLKDGVNLEGTDYTFKVYGQTENTIDGNEKGLVSIAGKASKSSKFTVDGEKLKGEIIEGGAFSDITYANYSGITNNEKHVDGTSSSVEAGSVGDPAGESGDDKKDGASDNKATKQRIFVAGMKVNIADIMGEKPAGKVKYNAPKGTIKVNGSGVATLKKGGDFILEAVDKKTKTSISSCNVKIEQPTMTKKVSTALSSVSLNATDFITRGSEYTENPTWVSSKPAVASVDPVTGVVTLHKKGSAQIIAVFGGTSAKDKMGTKKKYKTKLKVTE